jgi:tRNA A-37 threonylcarbamoyl transferase component Bud32
VIEEDEAAESSTVRLTRLWEGQGLAGDAPDVGTTIVPRRPSMLLSVEATELAVESPGSEVDFTGQLAEGGTAIVHLAHQRGLEREVAVKVLKPEVSNPRTRARLLKEARLTGALEHPHIIPVHTIARTAEGEPLLVMKRIDGISWRQFIEAPDVRADAFAGETPFEKHLEVLMQVAKAVHYAHTRGVVHRDLKPENVMIGRFGDVYLLDWGIAVRFDEGEVREEQVAGTPGYLAPEMAGGGAHPISPRTDVYLLGAVLHELLTGEPPHHAPTMQAALFKAWRSQPPVYGPEIPADLAALCHKSMARDPADRLPDAEAFRLALVEHLKNRTSIGVAREASQRLAQLQAAVAQRDPAPVHRYYGAARFGFEHALRIWPANEAAQGGLQTTLEQMITFELDQANPNAAEAIIADLPEARPELAARIFQVRAEATARELELANLRALERDLAPEVGARTRVRLALIIGALLAALAMGAGFFSRRILADGQLHPSQYLPHGVLLVTLAGGFLFWKRKTLLRTGLNRRISLMTLMVVAGGALAFRGVAALTGLPFLPLIPLEFVLYGVGIAVMGFATQRRLALAALPEFLGAVVMVLLPRYLFEIAGLTVAATLVVMAWVWQRDVTPNADA